MEGGSGGKKRKRLPASPTILENAPWNLTVRFICKLTARQHDRQRTDYQIWKKLLSSLKHAPRDCKSVIKRSSTIKESSNSKRLLRNFLFFIVKWNFESSVAFSQLKPCENVAKKLSVRSNSSLSFCRGSRVEGRGFHVEGEGAIFFSNIFLLEKVIIDAINVIKTNKKNLKNKWRVNIF